MEGLKINKGGLVFIWISIKLMSNKFTNSSKPTARPKKGRYGHQQIYKLINFWAYHPSLCSIQAFLCQPYDYLI